MRRFYCLMLCLVLLVPLLASGQESILRLRPYDGTPESFLNRQIAADNSPAE